MTEPVISIKAPPAMGALTKADCTYLIDKISHNRFIISSRETISTAASKIYEAGKTIVHVAEALMEGMSISEIIIHISTNNGIAEGLFTIRDLNTTGMALIADNPITHSFTIQVIYESLEDNTGRYIVTIMDRLIPVKRIIYDLNEYEIMSYDMNFPAPSVFLNEVVASIMQIL